jgi:glycerophosphoryl diester phosphodiesterase
MADLLQRCGRSTDLIAGSFIDEATNNFKAVAPCVYTFLPLGQTLEVFVLFLATGEIPDELDHISAQVPPGANQIGDQIPGDDPIPIVTPELVAAIHAANYAVQVWTINTCEEMLRMIDIGVDGIMTDQPLLLESVLAQPPGERRCE